MTRNNGLKGKPPGGGSRGFLHLKGVINAESNHLFPSDRILGF